MKLLTSIFFGIFIVLSCNSEQTESTSNELLQPTFPPDIQKKVENINYLDSAGFAKANATILAISKTEFERTNSSENKLLSERFCKQSKGYQKGTWEGKNDCSWAVEANNLEKFEQKANRIEDTLALKLNNGETIKYIHNTSKPEYILYYQFKNYFEEMDFFVLEEIQKTNCKKSILINANDGNSFQIKGTLYFSKDKRKFLATTFDKEFPLNCTNKIEMYQFTDSQIEKLWHIPTGNWGVTEAKFINQTEFLLEQSTSGIPSEYKRYAKVTALKQSHNF